MTLKAKGSYLGPKHLEQITLSYTRFIENGQAKPRQHYKLLASEVPTEDSKVSMWFSSNIGEGSVIVVEGRVLTDFIDEVIKESLFLFLFASSLRGGDWNRLGHFT